MTKICVKCGSAEFSPRGDCVPCKRVYDAIYRVKNKEKVLATQKKCYEAKKDEYTTKARQHYAQNKEKVAEWGKQYRAENKQSIAEKKKAYVATNEAKILAWRKEHYANNKERILRRIKDYVSKNAAAVEARQKQYREVNAEKLAERSREWLANNKDRASKRGKEYYLANPEKFADARTRRRSLEENKRLSKGLVDLILIEQGGKCPGCLDDITRATLHIDHFVPLSKGGKHEDDNIQLLCAHCNLTKHAAMPDKWFSRILQ